MMLERWLPALAAAVGLSLMMAAAVAQGQPTSAPQAVPPMAGPGPG